MTASPDAVTPEKVASAAADLRAARRVVIVPGYGVAVAQAGNALAHLADTLRRAGAEVVFALHPVAGRMPGQLNVLLDAAGVAWADLRDLETTEFGPHCVALVVGANDAVNAALPMPVLEVERAGAVVVVTRSTGPGYAGVPNPLFDRVMVLRGQAREVLAELNLALANPRDEFVSP